VVDNRERWVILVRNPRSDKVFVIHRDEDDDAMVYGSRSEAEQAARELPVCRAWPYRVVEAP
jgi:hypothetical protein